MLRATPSRLSSLILVLVHVHDSVLADAFSPCLYSSSSISVTLGMFTFDVLLVPLCLL